MTIASFVKWFCCLHWVLRSIGSWQLFINRSSSFLSKGNWRRLKFFSTFLLFHLMSRFYLIWLEIFDLEWFQRLVWLRLNTWSQTSSMRNALMNWLYSCLVTDWDLLVSMKMTIGRWCSKSFVKLLFELFDLCISIFRKTFHLRNLDLMSLQEIGIQINIIQLLTFTHFLLRILESFALRVLYILDLNINSLQLILLSLCKRRSLISRCLTPCSLSLLFSKFNLTRPISLT